MKSIILASVYFGDFPYYFSLFKESANYNKDINWIIFTDREETHDEGNIKFIKFSIEEFNKLASEKMGLDINISKPYKLCDFKPAYGKIFEDYFEEYDFWGHSDIDIIWGDIRKFIPDKILEENDIVSADKRYLCGVFSIYKNTEKLKNIYKNLRENYDTLIKTEKYENLDEVDYDVINERIPNLKIFSRHQCGGGHLDLQRYGKDRTPAHWKDGKMIIESYLTDYPGQKAFCGFGAETMFFHVRERMRWHSVDPHTKSIVSLKTPNHLCRNSKVVYRELFFNIKRVRDITLNHKLPENFLTKKVDKALMIHTTFLSNISNYYHWLIDAMPHILNALKEVENEDRKIIFYSIPNDENRKSLRLKFLNQEILETKYISEYLELVGLKDRVLPIENNTRYEVTDLLDYKNYIYDSKTGQAVHPDQNIKNIRDFCLDLNLPKHCPSVGKKIYVARKDKRSVSRAAEKMILSYGFEKLYMEDYSVLEQAAIFYNAKMIVSPHGAQLGNLIFCKSGAQIIELSNGWNYTCFPDVAIKTMAGNMGFHRELWMKGQTESFQSLNLNFLHVFEEQMYENNFIESTSINHPKYVIKDPMNMAKSYDAKNRTELLKSNKQKNVSPCLKRLEMILRRGFCGQV